MFQMKVVKQIETFYVQKLFPEYCAIYETMWKNIKSQTVHRRKHN